MLGLGDHRSVTRRGNMAMWRRMITECSYMQSTGTFPPSTTGEDAAQPMPSQM